MEVGTLESDLAEFAGDRSRARFGEHLFRSTVIKKSITRKKKALNYLN